jgi:translation initiation factor 3 subunit F
MLQLHRKANRKEVVVGWYASACDTTTGTDANGSDDADKAPVVAPLVSDTSSLIHDFYATEAEDGDPIHLVVDTRLLDDSIQIRGYTSSPVLIQNEPLANLFHEIKVVVQSTEAEAICLNEMHKHHMANDATNNNNNNTTTTTTTTTTDKKNPVSQLQASMGQLLQLLETTSSYVDDVVDGRRPADPTVGRAISNVMAQVPRILPASRFETVFHENLQDLLMVTYLSNLTRTQLDIAEKLQTSLGI